MAYLYFMVLFRTERFVNGKHTSPSDTFQPEYKVGYCVRGKRCNKMRLGP